jgi:hypothetical protein
MVDEKDKKTNPESKTSPDSDVQENPQEPDDDVPIGDLLNKELEKERQEMEKDIQTTGVGTIGQGADEEQEQKKKGVLGLFSKGNSVSSAKQNTPAVNSGMQPQGTGGSSGGMVMGAENFVSKLEFEKYKVKMDSMAERAKFFEQSGQKTAEEIGELRAMNFKNDKMFSEIDIKMKKLEQLIALVEPEKLAVELKKRKKDIMQNEVRINKLENLANEAFKRASKVEQIFEDLGDVKTLTEIRKELSLKLVAADRLRDDSERYSKLAEKMFAEINKKLVDFESSKSKIKRNEEIIKSIMTDIDLNKAKIGSSLTKEEFEQKLNEIREELNIVKTISSIDDIRHVLEKLESKRKEIKEFLNVLKEDYNKGIISKNAFEETFENNKRALKLIRYKIQEIEKNKIKLIKDRGESNPLDDEVEREVQDALSSDRIIQDENPSSQGQMKQSPDKDLSARSKEDSDTKASDIKPDNTDNTNGMDKTSKEDDESKYEELKKKIKIWKDKGYNVDALEEELVALSKH